MYYVLGSVPGTFTCRALRKVVPVPIWHRSKLSLQEPLTCCGSCDYQESDVVFKPSLSACKGAALATFSLHQYLPTWWSERTPFMRQALSELSVCHAWLDAPALFSSCTTATPTQWEPCHAWLGSNLSVCCASISMLSHWTTAVKVTPMEPKIDISVNAFQQSFLQWWVSDICIVQSCGS